MPYAGAGGLAATRRFATTRGSSCRFMTGRGPEPYSDERGREYTGADRRDGPPVVQGSGVRGDHDACHRGGGGRVGGQRLLLLQVQRAADPGVLRPGAG